MKFLIELTWSKIMALVIAILGFVIDIKTNSGGTVFMFTIPFVVFLITGKQLIDTRKKKEE